MLFLLLKYLCKRTLLIDHTAELHDAKHQPDIKDGRNIGMPLADFTAETWAGLEAGKDEIPVGMSAKAYDAFELKRQEMFHGMVKMMAGGGKP